MPSHRRSWYLAMLVAVVLVFVLLPAVCTSVDHHHGPDRSHCQFCAFVMAYSSVLAGVVCTFGIIHAFLRVVRIADLASGRAVDLASLPPIRAPPSTAACT